MKLEDYPQTHDGAVAFVKDVFRGMGGRVRDNITGYMEKRLHKLENNLAVLRRRAERHDCIRELTGVCPFCESYWDMRDEIEYEIMLEKEDLAPIWAMQSKKNLACVCKGIDTSSLQDSIVALGLTINGQR